MRNINYICKLFVLLIFDRLLKENKVVEFFEESVTGFVFFPTFKPTGIGKHFSDPDIFLSLVTDLSTNRWENMVL